MIAVLQVAAPEGDSGRVRNWLIHNIKTKSSKNRTVPICRRVWTRSYRSGRATTCSARGWRKSAWSYQTAS